MRSTAKCVCGTLALFLMLTGAAGAGLAEGAELVDDFMAGRITTGAFLALIPSSGSSMIPSLKTALELTEDPEKSASLIEALVALKANGREKDIRLALSKTNGKRRERLEYISIISLRNIQTIDAVRIILDIVKDSKDYDVQSLGRSSIELIHGQGTAPVFIDELKRTDGLIELSIEKLGNMHAVEAAAPLVPFLKHESTGVRNIAAQALYLIADKRVMDRLKECLVEEKDEFVRVRIEGALVRMGSRDAATMLRDRFSGPDDNPEIRVYAVNMLYCASLMSLADDLAELTKDEQPRVRIKAVELLKGVGCMSAVPALEEISLKDVRKDLREYSRQVIEILKKKGPCACEANF